MILSPSQDEAKTKITHFLKSYNRDDNMFILEGSAGTGKSTVITHILSNTGSGTQYSSYGCLYKNSSTAWGAQVLNNSGNDIYLYLGLKNTVNLS